MSYPVADKEQVLQELQPLGILLNVLQGFLFQIIGKRTYKFQVVFARIKDESRREFAQVRTSTAFVFRKE